MGRIKRVAVTHTLPYVKWIASGKLQYTIGSSTRFSVITQRGGMGGGGMERQEGVLIYMCCAELSP